MTTDDESNDLGTLYRAASNEQPPKRLDDAILAASRRAVNAAPKAVGPFSRRGLPLSMAAVLVMSVSVVWLIQRESSTEYATQSQTKPLLNIDSEQRQNLAEQSRSFASESKQKVSKQSAELGRAEPTTESKPRAPAPLLEKTEVAANKPAPLPELSEMAVAAPTESGTVAGLAASPPTSQAELQPSAMVADRADKEQTRLKSDSLADAAPSRRSLANSLATLLTEKARDWSFVQSIGGIAMGQPLRQGVGWSLPLRCDVSGRTTISWPPTMIHSGLAYAGITVEIVGADIYITLNTRVVDSGKPTTDCSIIALGNIPAGNYTVYYRSPDKSAVVLGAIRVSKIDNRAP